LPEVDWAVADRLVRVVKTIRIEHPQRVTVSEKDGRRIKRKTELTQESTNFYATNFELGSVSPLFIHQFGAAVGESIRRFFRPSHRLSPQTPRGPPNHGAGGAYHDPVSCL
jgi:hypothetical protein